MKTYRATIRAGGLTYSCEGKATSPHTAAYRALCAFEAEAKRKGYKPSDIQPYLTMLLEGGV